MKCIKDMWIAKRRRPDGTWEVEGQRLAGWAECGHCGAEIELWQDVDEWETNTGKITLGGWGPALGECEKCNLLFVDSWDRMEVYNLGKVGV